MFSLTLLAPRTRAASWQWRPWVGLSGGHESDLVPDPDLAREVVPGGAFLELTPGFVLSRPLSSRTQLRLLNRTSVQRFLDADERTLLAGSLLADLRLRLAADLRARVTLDGHAFDDSGDDTFERWAGGGEAGLSWRQRRWSVEASGFVQGRRYPGVTLTDPDGETRTYTERRQGLGARLLWSPADRLLLDLDYTWRTTEALGPDYDAAAHLVGLDVDTRLWDGGWATVHASGQWRRFDARPEGEDTDAWWTYGLGLRQDLTPWLQLSLRAARSVYTDPVEADQTVDRVWTGLLWRFGTGSPAGPAVGSSPGGVAALQGSEEAVRFRIHAPGAAAVSVVGSFNGWRPGASPLQPAGDGWWEARLPLAPGMHEYVYLVDGEPTLPPQGAPTVPDGFGGRNAVVEVVAFDAAGESRNGAAAPTSQR
jgi:hypothetical protein